jgi:nicotinate (nicotinamide) nucleotide adenylyltransferase
VALEFRHRSENRNLRRAALFPGAYNPPTVAHVAIAHAALRRVDEVIWILPRAFPHKDFDGPGPEARLNMLRAVTESETRYSTAVTEGGLYLEMAEEARTVLGPEPEIELLCGRDAAERIAAWDYGEPGVFERMIARFPLLVAGRAGEYLPSAQHAERIVPLALEASFDEISSTEVRRRIQNGEPWRHLVPDSIADTIAALYPAGSRKR